MFLTLSQRKQKPIAEIDVRESKHPLDRGTNRSQFVQHEREGNSFLDGRSSAHTANDVQIESLHRACFILF